MPTRLLAAKNPLIVAGIDPGSRVMGYGLVARDGSRQVAVDFGAFRTKTQATVSERLGVLGANLRKLFEHHAPDVVALERAFVRTNPQSAIRLGEARGVVLLCAAERGIPVIEYTAPMAKKSVCGYGAASKEDAAAGVQALLDLDAPPSPLDATDALALALCLLADPAFDPRIMNA